MIRMIGGKDSENESSFRFQGKRKMPEQLKVVARFQDQGWTEDSSKNRGGLMPVVVV